MLHLKKLLSISLDKKKAKSWMTSGIQQSIYNKNTLLNFINKKDPHEQYKTYANLLSKVRKQSKQIYHTKYFENNWTGIALTMLRKKSKQSFN